MKLSFLFAACASLSLTIALAAGEPPLVPRIAGDWLTVASSPDLGKLSAPKQQPVDFGVW